MAKQPPSPKQPPAPAPKVAATTVPPPEQAKSADEHEERMIDEAEDESFPASDPPAIGTKKKSP